jgi:hypothetical protein
MFINKQFVKKIHRFVNYLKNDSLKSALILTKQHYWHCSEGDLKRFALRVQLFLKQGLNWIWGFTNWIINKN